MNILIVDDDPSMLRLLRHHLEKLGHDVDHAEDGVPALMTWIKGRYPLVITDWNMPQMSGIDLCHKIREIPRDFYTYLIIVTSYETKGHFREGMAAGADDFLTKPVDVDQLATRLTVAERIMKLQSTNKRLASLIPICMYCKKARDDAAYWQELDQFLLQHTDVAVSHGVCPECLEKAMAASNDD